MKLNIGVIVWNEAMTIVAWHKIMLTPQKSFLSNKNEQNMKRQHILIEVPRQKTNKMRNQRQNTLFCLICTV